MEEIEAIKHNWPRQKELMKKLLTEWLETKKEFWLEDWMAVIDWNFIVGKKRAESLVSTAENIGFCKIINGKIVSKIYKGK